MPCPRIPGAAGATREKLASFYAKQQIKKHKKRGQETDRWTETDCRGWELPQISIVSIVWTILRLFLVLLLLSRLWVVNGNHLTRPLAPHSGARREETRPKQHLTLKLDKGIPDWKFTETITQECPLLSIILFVLS